MNLNTWTIYKNTTLAGKTTSVSIPKDNSKGSLFYFEVSRAEGVFVLGEEIQLVMPIGTPVYICRVTGLSEKPDDANTIQVQAAIISVDTSGIR